MTSMISHVWKPARARTLTIDGPVRVPRGTVALAPALASWPPKDPADILDYQLDIGPALQGNEGDYISGVDVVINPSMPGDLSLDNVAADGSNIILWFSAGFAAVSYVVTLKIALSSGRGIQRSILLPVISLSSISVPANALLTTTGDPLTDEWGAPLT